MVALHGRHPRVPAHRPRLPDGHRPLRAGAEAHVCRQPGEVHDDALRAEPVGPHADVEVPGVGAEVRQREPVVGRGPGDAVEHLDERLGDRAVLGEEHPGDDRQPRAAVGAHELDVPALEERPAAARPRAWARRTPAAVETGGTHDRGGALHGPTPPADSPGHNRNPSGRCPSGAVPWPESSMRPPSHRRIEVPAGAGSRSGGPPGGT